MFQKLKALSRLKKIGLGLAAVTLIGIAGSGNQPKADLNVQNASSKSVLGAQTVNEKPTPKAPVVTTKTTTETQIIPFDSTTVTDSSLPKGQTKITTTGVNGVLTLTYKLTYTDDKQTDKELIGQVTTTQPVTQVTTVGAYVAPAQPVCPNGTYVNSYGNTVCSPYASSSAPAGATAKCRDGSYSFSQSHSGTCSHHGGVAEWL